AFAEDEFLHVAGWYGGSNAVASDLDGDGDLPLVYGAGGDNACWTIEHLGAGTFAAPVELGGWDAYTAMEPLAVRVADMDGDGDGDMLAQEIRGDEGAIYWRENVGGGTFGGTTEIEGELAVGRTLRVADLDEDGD